MYLTHPTRLINRISSLGTLITLAIVIVAALLFVTCSHAIDSPAKAGASQRMKTIIVNNYHPYTFVNDKGEPDGFSVEIAKAVARSMDLELEIRADKWDVAMKELEAGSIDLLPMMAYSPERDKIFDFSVPHTIAYDAIFIKKGTTGLRSLKDLSGKTVIVMSKDIAHSYLLSSGLSKTMTLNLVDSLPDALKQLSAGKGDAAIMPKLVGIVTAKKLNFSEIETSPQLIDAYTRPFSFAVKNGNQELLERLNQGLNIIKSTGQYDVIYKKWFGALEDPHLDLKTAIKYASGALLIIIASIAWNVMLKRQVRAKTKHLEAEIDERKKAEEALKESEYRWGFALEGAGDGVWDWNIQTGGAIYSRRYKEMLGFAENEIGNTSDEWLKRIHPEDAPGTIIALQPYLDGKTGTVRVEFRMLCKDGNWKWILGRGMVVSRDSDGKPLRMIGTNTDITGRKSEEEQIKTLTQRLLLATSSAHLGVWDWNVRDNTMVWDDRMFELYGVKPDTFPSNIDAWTNGLHPDDKDRAIAECQAALNGEQEFDTVFRVLHPDGTEIYLKANAIVIRGTDGKAERMLGINADITDSIQSSQLLRNSEESYRNLFNSCEIAIFRTRLDGTEVLDVNQKFLDMLGMTREETVGKPSQILWADPNEREKMVQMLLTDGRVSGYEYKMLTKHGEIRNCITSLLLYQEKGILEGSILDITKLKQAESKKQELEQQFQHTQKLESLGVLAGGIAHDFNNILAIIMGYCSLTKMDYETTENNILEIEKAAERAAALCRQMLAYAGKAQLAKTQVNMWTLVDEMASMLKTTLPQNAVIKPDLSTKIPFINADASQLRQIVMNLIINASEAIGKEQGEIQVSLANTTLIAGQSDSDYIGKPIPPGEYVRLEVTDNGCGMDEETKWRIFEPFYTTKFTGRGLGMSAVLGIINSHGGALQFHSQLGQGTTFKVYLPVQKTDSARDEDSSISLPSASWKGSGTILLVEDEDQVRLIAKALLKNIGLTVIEAVNGKEALELYSKYSSEITLVITDMGMPVMDGYELFRELKKIRPGLPIIISSGFGDNEVSSRIDQDDIAGMISKPYTPEKLREVLKSAIEGRNC